MAVLKAKARNKLSKGKFGLPGQRKYPVNDANHARNAISRASEQFNKGRLSASEKAEIVRAAHKELNR
jgi:hypothetical protein